MYPNSDEFFREISTSHEVYSYCEVTGPNLDAKRVQLTGGTVTCDVTAQYRRYGNFTFVDPDGTLEDLLIQPGVDLRPFRGVKYADGRVEGSPLGVLRLSTYDAVDGSDGTFQITVECYDWSRTISRDAFTTPYVIAQGTNLLDAIKDILARTFAGLEYDAVTTNITTIAPKVYDAQNDPWQAATDLASSMGCEIYFDQLGRVVISPPTDIDALPSPDFEYNEGKGCTMMTLEKKYSDDPGYNGVVLTGESVGDEADPVQSLVWDEEPTSFTYHKGPYGEVPLFITDQNVKTQDDCDAAAAAWLHALLGFSYQITLTTTVNPAHDCGDVVRVTRAKSRVFGDLFVIDALVMPFRASETATVTLRQKRVR